MHAELGRAQASGDRADIEARQRDLDVAMANFEREQRALQEMQHGFDAPRDSDRVTASIDEIFERAWREGKASRD